MRRPRTKRKCKHCRTFFAPDPRSAKRQRYCATPACRQASKAASHARWLQKPGNRDYFTGLTHVERVRQWRRAHPGYWRRPDARASQALQDDIAATARRLQQLGRDILYGATPSPGGIPDAQTPHLVGQTPHRPRQLSWVDQRRVREHYIDQLSPQACALYLFLVTVADTQRLSYYADASLCQRLSMTSTELSHARHALIMRGLVAYHRPLYQVLALDVGPLGAPSNAASVAADDEPVDLKAVFARI